jgi:BMFP domain-containing protein YqiC
MLAEERENVDALRAAVEHAEQRFVDESDARKAAGREIAELKARIVTLEAMR